MVTQPPDMTLPMTKPTATKPPLPRMTAAEVSAFLDEAFPQIHLGGRIYHVEAVGPLSARMRCDYHERLIRPGGIDANPSAGSGMRRATLL